MLSRCYRRWWRRRKMPGAMCGVSRADARPGSALGRHGPRAVSRNVDEQPWEPAAATGDSGPGYVLLQPPPDAPLTARNLEDFALCPRKYLLSFFEPAAQTVRFVGGPAALHRAVRAALVEMYAAGGPQRYPLERLLERFEGAWDGRACADSREEEDLHRDGLSMLQRHHAQPLAAAGAPQADLRLEGRIGGEPCVAVADVAWSSPPRVVRFTTARRPPTEKELRESLSWTLLYLLAVQHWEAEGLVAVMVDLRRGREVEYALSDGEQEAAARRIAELAGRLRRERDHPPRPGKHCRWCRSRAQCPAGRRR